MAWATRDPIRRWRWGRAARPLGWGVVGLFATAVLHPDALADSLVDAMGPREVAMGEAGRAEAYGSQATRLNPSGLALEKLLVFEGGYGYRDGDSASSVGVSACDSTVPVGACYYYNYFRSEPEPDLALVRRVHEFGTSAAAPLSREFSLGITGRFFDANSNVGSETDKRGYGFDAGATFRPSEVIKVGVAGYNLVASESFHTPMGVGGGIVLRPGQGQFALKADGLWNFDLPDGAKTGRYGGGAEYFMPAASGKQGYALRAGGLFDRPSDAGYLTGGLGFSTGSVALDVGGRVQVSGEGENAMIIGSLRLFGPSQ